MTLRAAVIGLGVGEQHIAGYQAHSSCQVVALCDLDEAKLATAAERYPAMRRTRDPLSILDDPSIDVVSIASYDDAHHEQVVRAIGQGKHVFAEKPLCLHDRELRDIRKALGERPDVRLSSNHILRLCPRFVRLRDSIAAGEFGDVYYVEGDYDYGRLHKITGGWRGRLDYYSVVMGGAIHMVDLLLWLTGRRVEEVIAYGNAICSRGTSFRFDDLIVALLRLDGGAIAKIAANFGCVRPHFHSLDVYGTEATFLNDLPDARLFQSRDPDVEPKAIDDPYPGVGKGDLIHGFLDWILYGTPPPVGPEDVFDTTSVCLAIERSAREGRPIPVEYI